MWNGKKPNLKNLQIFGNIAYAKRLGNLKKLEKRSEEYKFVGYGPKSYHLWDERKRKIILSRDVIFEKHYTKIKILGARIEQRKDNEEREEQEKEDEEIYEDALVQMEENNIIQEEDAVQEERSETEEDSGRPKRNKKLPVRYNDYVMATYSYKEVTSGEEKERWFKAIEEEKKSLKENET